MPRCLIVEGGAPAFSPADVAGLLFWHDSVLSARTMNGADVSQWNDLSGNARHWVQATAGNQPTTRTNGRLLIDFDGGNEEMGMGTGHGISTAAHLFMVAVIDTNISSDSFMSAGAVSDTDDGFQLRQQTSLRIQGMLSDGTTPRDDNTSTATFALGTAAVFEMSFNGAGDLSVVIDGTARTITASNGGCTGPDALSLMGRGSTGNQTADGAVAVTLAYSAPIAGADLTALRTYLNAIRDSIV